MFPDGHTDGYGYTGLGMRLTKGDPTGSYSYLADGVSPASPVLTDGHTTFTPGVSEYNALGSRFYLGDAQGNGRALLDGGQSATDGYNWDAFGSSVSRFGSNPTAFAWNGEAGYQSDNDSGLKLLGHRYYDSRTGRFISQDPAGDGDNWYAYADNDPMDETDPSGLSSFFDPSKAGMGPGAGPSAWGDYNSGSPGTYDFFSGGTYTHSETISEALNAAFTSTSGPMMGARPAGMGGGRGGSGRFAAGGYGQSSVTTPEGAQAVAQLQEDGIVVGRPRQIPNPAKEIYKTYDEARNSALKWLEDRGFTANKPYKGRYSSRPNGMQSADGKTGFRVEYDKRSEAHINVFNGKEKGPHFRFVEGTKEMVEQIIKRFGSR